MSNNYGLGTRSLKKAGRFALERARDRRTLGFESVGTNAGRWNLFVDYLKENHPSIKKLEHVDAIVVIDYGRELAHLVCEEVMAPATAHNYVSAVNAIMDIATAGRWGSISPKSDCGIPARTFVRMNPPTSINRDAYSVCRETIRLHLGDRAACIVGLCREFGLRSKEASLADARAWLAETSCHARITVRYGTKGGRPRHLPVISASQIEVLGESARAQGGDKSMIHTDLTWAKWREGGLRDIRKFLQVSLGATGLHDLRAGYACQRYQEITGITAPVTGASEINRDLDRHARQIIAEELGHGRAEITNAYVGGRR